MNTLTVKDLEMNIELDKHAATSITGGKFFTSTGDLHKWIYGDESPYGRGWKAPQLGGSYSTTDSFSFSLA